MHEGKHLSTQEFYTIEEAVQEVGFGKFQIRLTFLAGIGWLADSFEIFILSVIGDLIACDWVLYRWQTALLSSIVFAGIMVGSPILGVIADVYGRKKCLAVSVILLFVFGSVSAASPSFTWMLAFRTCLGIALGGIAQAVTLCSEFCPTHMRGKTVFYMCYFWSLGSFGIILLTWIVMEYMDNWRILLALAAIPSLIVILSLKFYPESARFHLVSGDRDRAVALLGKMADDNGRELPRGQLQLVNSELKRGRVSDLLSEEHRKTSLLFWIIWFSSAFAYYGIVFISPTVIHKGGVRESATDNSTQSPVISDMLQVMPCAHFSRQNYIDLLWTSGAEFPGLIVFTFLIEKVDRKKLLSCSCILSSIFSMLLLLNTHKVAILAFLFIARAILVAIFQLNYLMTSEAYPTTVRAVAMGTGTAFCRLGGLIVPYIAQVLLVSNPVTAISLLGGLVFVAGIAAACLPQETRGKHMKESQMAVK